MSTINWNPPKDDKYVTRVKRCPDCRGSGVTSYTKFYGEYEPNWCKCCHGNGSVLYFELVAPLDLSRMAEVLK